MPTNVVRTRTAESRSPIETPPVMVSIPDLDPVVPDTATPNTGGAAQTATTGETSRGRMAPGDRLRQSRKKKKHSLRRLTDPFWTHWGTKVGLAVGACLLLAVLYQVLGKGGSNPPPAGEGDLPTESEMAAAVAGANLGGEKKGQKPAAKRPAGAKRPRPPAAGKKQDGLALQPPGTNAGGRPKPPGKPDAKKPVTAASPPKKQPNGPAGSPVPKKPDVRPKERPAIAGPVAEKKPAERATAERLATDSGPAGLGGGSPAGTVPARPDLSAPAAPQQDHSEPRSAAAGVAEVTGGGVNPPASHDGQHHAVSHAPAGSQPAPPSRDGRFRPAAPDTGVRGTYPSTNTPGADYTPWPRPESRQSAATAYDRMRASGGPAVPVHGEPPAAGPRYPRTQIPTEDYLKRRVAGDGPEYRTSMRQYRPLSPEQQRQASERAGTARLQGIIESPPIRSRHE